MRVRAHPDRWPSGQWQQTVNLSEFTSYEGSNPSLSTTPFLSVFFSCADSPDRVVQVGCCSSVGRAHPW